MAAPARIIPLDLTILPDQRKVRTNVYAGIYGEGGTGKGQMALRIAHRLTAPYGGLIVVIEADDKRMRHHAKDSHGNGFSWKPVPFDEADPLRLVQVLNELTASAAAYPGPVVVIGDGMTRFWNDPLGLKWRNLHIHAKKLTRDGKSDLSSWVPTGEEEHLIYRALRRLHAEAHIILCLEQANVFSGQRLAGVGPDFRKGLTHELGFLFRMERYLGQSDTEHEAHVRNGAASAHRAIVEKTPLVTLQANNDGTVDFEYPMPTGQVFADPGYQIADMMLAELDGIEDSAEAEAAHFLACLQGQDRDNLLAAHRYVEHKDWPLHVIESTREAIVEMGKNLSESQPSAITVDTQVVVQGLEALVTGSPEQEWHDAIDATTTKDAWTAVKNRAADQEVLEIYKEYLAARWEEIVVPVAVDGEVLDAPVPTATE